MGLFCKENINVTADDDIQIQFVFVPFMFQHDNSPCAQSQLHKETVFPKVIGLAGAPVLDLTDALVSKWEKIPAASFQHLGGKPETRRVEAVIAAD